MKYRITYPYKNGERYIDYDQKEMEELKLFIFYLLEHEIWFICVPLSTVKDLC